MSSRDRNRYKRKIDVLQSISLDLKRFLKDFIDDIQLITKPHNHNKSDITDFSVDIDEINTTGTASSSNYLRGDGQWSEVPTVYELIKCYGNISGTSFANAEALLQWNAPVIGNSGSSNNVTISNSDITINVAGTYKFTVSLRTDNSNRSELFIRTYFETETPDDYDEQTLDVMSNYAARDTDQNTGGVILQTSFVLTAGQKLQFRGFSDSDGSCTGLNEGTILQIERVV